MMLKAIVCSGLVAAAFLGCDPRAATDDDGESGGEPSTGGTTSNGGAAGSGLATTGGSGGGGQPPTGGSAGTGATTGGTAGAPAGGTAGSAGSNMYPPQPAPYRVQGNQVLDVNNQVHRFYGMSRPSFEWVVEGEQVVSRDWQLMKSWGANVVRLPLNQVFWMRIPSYKTRIGSAVQSILQHGMDVILDLHWSTCSPDTASRPECAGSPAASDMTGQEEMANQGSIAFWTDVANSFKSSPHILFELYNEPKLVSQGGNAWNIWLNGGTIAGVQRVGMAQLYQAVRATGATNLVIIGGIDWAYNLSGVPSHPIPNAMNVMYATHPYALNGKMMGDWEADWGFLTASAPVIVTEFGRTDGNCEASYASQVINYANSKGASWIGWAWYPGGCAFPALITDLVTGAPTAVGTVVRQSMMSLAGL